MEGGGVSRPVEKLDSGELAGVRETEDISRQDRDFRLPHQNIDDVRCNMLGLLTDVKWRC